MGFAELLFHTLNFLAPAFWLGLGLAVLAPVLMKNSQRVRAWWSQFALNFIAGAAALSLGLALLGRDGKMLSYAGLVLACTTTQWLGQRAWR